MQSDCHSPTVPLTIPRSIDLALGSHLRRFELNAVQENDRAIAAALRARIDTGGTLKRGPCLDVSEAELRVLAWVIGAPLHPYPILRPSLQTSRETAGFRALRDRIARNGRLERRTGEGGFRLVDYAPRSTGGDSRGGGSPVGADPSKREAGAARSGT